VHIIIPSTSEVSKLIAASEKDHKNHLGNSLNFWLVLSDDIKLRMLGL
jgi:hypothetical protein